MENVQIFERKKREMNREAGSPTVPQAIQNTTQPQSPVADVSSVEIPLIFPTAGLILAVIMGYFAFSFLSYKTKEVEEKAKYQCAQTHTYEAQNGDNTTSYPADELYVKCLVEKGVNK